MSFASISTRSNGQKITYDWFNVLRTAGVSLEGYLGSGFIGETSFTIANNTAVAANVTGLSFASASYKSAHILVEIRRKTDSVELVSNGRLIVQYRNLTTTWELLDEMSGDDDGVTFSVTSGGQVQYTSTNQSGSNYTGVMKFKAITFAA